MNCNGSLVCASHEYSAAATRYWRYLSEPCGGCAAVHTARGGARRLRGAGPGGRRSRSARHSRRGRHSADTYRSVLSASGSVLRANHNVSRETACVVTVHI